MSHNQSRGERTEFGHYMKTGRSGNNNNNQQQRVGGGGAGSKGDGGGDLSAPTLNQPRSFKRYNNGQGGQARGGGPMVNVNSINQNAAQNIQSLSHFQQQTPHGLSSISGTTAPIKQVDAHAPAPNITYTVPKAPSSGVSMASSETWTPVTPAKVKAPGGSSQPITLQFSTMSPNVVNGMHIPARTSSALPNIDEQKREQARHQASGSSHDLPTSSIPKQQVPKLDVGTVRHSTAVDSHSISKPKAAEHVSAVPATTQVPKPSVQPPMFVPHQMPPPGLIHQGQGYNFSPPMPPRMSPQLGNMGISMSPQFHQHQAGKFSGPRKVKITHQETHEDLRFDGLYGPRSNPNMPPQSQPILSFQHFQVNYLPNSLLAPGSPPVGSTRANSHPPPQRSYNKVTVKPSGGWNKERDTNSLTSASLGAKHLGPGIGPSFPSATMPVTESAEESFSESKDIATTPVVMRPSGLRGPLQRNNSESERWQRRTNFQKGLMPYALTPPPIIHRSENKYLVGKVTYVEQAKQRQLKGILNKLTPQNFEKLFEQVKKVKIDNLVTLTGAISQIYDKALMEPEMYANFCYHLAAELPDMSVGDEKITFKRLLLNMCQEEFERGEREQEEGEVKQSEEEREEKRLQALGNIRLIGELYKKGMLTERIMHECIKKLLGGPDQIPDEEDLEALCKLMSTIGEMIDHPRAKVHMDVYFDMMVKLSTNMKLSSRVRFMLLDSIDLRKNKWQQRRKVEGPKKIDEEQAKQRQLKGILNKLTPQNFEKLFEQVKEVNIDNLATLTGVISQIFDKALMEPTFCEMYANFCYHLASELPDLSVGDEKITFKRLLLNKCQEEFERGEREQEEANKAEEEGEVKQSEGEKEEKRLQARRRMLGNIRLIGELYKKGMLTERIMHECIKKLLGGPDQIPDEEDLEALCKLMSTIGEMIDHPRAKVHMDVYFDMMVKLSTNMKLSSRVRFMLLDSIDLRKNKWQQRRKVEGPKKIDEVHRDAAQEKQAQTSRFSGTSSFGNPVRRAQPMDFGPRGSSGFSSPGSLIGGPHPIASHRSFGGQDTRFDDRHLMDNKTLSIPPHPRSDDSINLVPQGGLGRGMSYRGQPSPPSLPLSNAPSSADTRRMGNGLNSFNAMPDQTAYGSREDSMPRYMQERFANQSIYDQTSTQDPKLNYGTHNGRIADRGLERTKPSSPPQRDAGPSSQVFPEERLRDMSLSAIREFYSAKDENEVILCIKELNTPSYYPSMISLWVMDSFERKDLERGLLAKLLVNLARSRDHTISEDQLISGFESVLSTLEDTVNDAPKAAEFLGHLFAHVISEDIISLTAIGKLISEGGEEQGRLVEIGLAAEVLGTIFESISSKKGPSVLDEIRKGAHLQLKNFRPPGSSKPYIIDKFI